MKTTQSSLKSVGIAAMIAAVFAGGYAYRGTSQISEANATVVPNATNAAQTKMAVASAADFSEIVAQQGPAVVNISVSGIVKTGFPNLNGMPEMSPDDPFYEFFHRFQPDIPKGDNQVKALGSGFIVKSDGVVLTNAHVVAQADEVTVKLTDRREFKAKVVGLDKASDVAVLKIDAKNLPMVKIGNTQNARVGEWVLAIGSPFGFENSVTAGIVSAKSRSLPDEGYVPFLQTDVAINPGNSGGPLFNLQGEVIGINSQIYSRSGGSEGLSFAIPINLAMNVEKQILENGKVSRGQLGLTIQPVTQELAASFGLEKSTGALVSEVKKGSPAEKSGIEVGDVILKFNGKPLERSEDLPPLVADTTPGTNAQVEIWHNKRSKVTIVSVGEMNTESTSTLDSQLSKGKLGLMVRPLTDEEKKIAETSNGLIVEDVAEGPAARAGIHQGDIILSATGEKIDSTVQLSNLVNKSQGEIALLIIHDDKKIFVPVKIS